MHGARCACQSSRSGISGSRCIVPLASLLVYVIVQGQLVNASDATTSTSCAFTDESSARGYPHVMSAARSEGMGFRDLPGFTRSHYARDHALIAPESRVFTSQHGWVNARTAHLVSPAMGAHFAMFLAELQANATAGQAPRGVERFLFVTAGSVEVSKSDHTEVHLRADQYAFFPPDENHRVKSITGASLILFERVYSVKDGKAEFFTGSTSSQAVLPVDGETFVLRKLIPESLQYDFNIHVMDFRPGDFLNVKEMHHNQHGLVLLSGQGIYRLGDQWYPVQAGDAIWMAPFVLQWYAALGRTTSRYILYKDTGLDPVLANGVLVK